MKEESYTLTVTVKKDSRVHRATDHWSEAICGAFTEERPSIKAPWWSVNRWSGVTCACCLSLEQDDVQKIYEGKK